jgi:ABC-2 type transport system ATP-binding protein
LALVRALLHDPPVLLLDEPTSAMDPESARVVRDAIHTLRSGERTIILCTHNLVEAEELADQVAIIRKGRIVESDSVENLQQRLLGPMEFEAQITGSLNGEDLELPYGTDLVIKAAQSLRFRVLKPELTNPILLKNMLDVGLKVVSFQSVPRSLERVYLEAMNRASREEEHVL